MKDYFRLKEMLALSQKTYDLLSKIENKTDDEKMILNNLQQDIQYIQQSMLELVS